MPEAGHALRKMEMIAISIVVSVFLIYSDIVPYFLSVAKEWELLAVLIAGAMFTSVFTVAPATIVLSEIALSNTPWTVAVVGGLGAALADCAMLYLFKSQVRFHSVLPGEKSHYKRMRAFFHSPGWRWFGLVVGTIMIASPLPDELGLALMGFTNVRVTRLLPAAFVLNAIGIYLIALAAIAIATRAAA